MGITHNPGHAGKLGDLLRGALRIAAGHENLTLGVGATDTADNLTDFRIGCGGHRAGIQDGNLARGETSDFFEACLEQLLPQRRALRLISPATEIVKLKPHHSPTNHYSVTGNLLFQ